MKPKYRRMIGIGISLGIGAFAIGLILSTLRNQLVFYYAPTEITQAQKDSYRELRIGGLVEKGTLQSSPDRQSFAFFVTDYKERIAIRYRGLLPDLFREGQGVVAQGKFDAKGIFVAREILAKHDEKYVPPQSIPHLNPAARRLGRGERLEIESKQ